MNFFFLFFFLLRKTLVHSIAGENLIIPNSHPHSKGNPNYVIPDSHSSCSLADPLDDNAPNECLRNKTNPSTLLKSFLGKIICSENYDCNTCDVFNCTKCEEIICNGDVSCTNIEKIIIDGKTTGAYANCNGDVSCRNSTFTGKNVRGIHCGGDCSCMKSNVSVVAHQSGIKMECNGDASCFGLTFRSENVLNYICSGDDSCAYCDASFTCKPEFGCPLICTGDKSCARSKIKATGVTIASCSGESACAEGVFSLIFSLPYGGPLICSGSGSENGACEGSIFSVTNVNLISCTSFSSCKHAIISGTIVDESFKLICGDEACFGADIELVVSPDVEKIKLVECKGSRSCEYATITIKSSPGKLVELEEINCGGRQSCVQAKIILIGVYLKSPRKCGVDTPLNNFGLNSCTGLSLTAL